MGTLRSFLDSMLILPLRHPGGSPLGRTAGLRPGFRGRPRAVNDTWIATCSLVRELPLATFNTKDFVDFAEHEGLQLLS